MRLLSFTYTSPRALALGFTATMSLRVASSQQLPDTLLGNSAYPGLSVQCAEALNTTVQNCPGFLASASVDMPRLDSARLGVLCTPACRTSLSSVRGVIASACGAGTDVIEISSVVYPATFIIDRFLYTYDVSCAKDRVTGKFCDEMYHEALANGTKADSCSDCSLSVIRTQLNSPFGYHLELAQGFQSVTARCGATGYAFTSPAAYAISTKPYPVPTNAPTCGSPYVVQGGDTCDSIATAKGVSTHAVIKAASTDPDCTTLQAGAQLCLPDPCTVYRVQIDDTCEGILDSVNGLRAVDLLTWNPNINVLCTNIDAIFGQLICVSPPGRTLDQVTSISTNVPTTTQPPPTAVPRPTNAKAESHTRCAGWYEVQTGDYCQAISIRQAISLRDFYFLNPSVDSPDCLNLWLGTSYCVRAVGDINTYGGYPYSTSPVYTLTSSAYVTTTVSSLQTVEPSATPVVELPLAPGSFGAAQGCVEYVEHKEVTPRLDQSLQIVVPPFTDTINTCDFVCASFGVGLEDFLSWNPSLQGLSDCRMQPGLRYCALHEDSLDPVVPPEGSFCFDVTESYPGTISPCSCFTIIASYDSGSYLCEAIAVDFSITVADLVNWNPWIGPASSCDTGIYAGLESQKQRPVCVKAGGSSTTTTSTPTQTPTTTPPTTPTSVVPPGPTQPGIVAGCRRYYVAVSGDGCWAIADANGIALDDFYAWNPAVGTDCSGLWLGYAYCVQGPALPSSSATTTTQAATSTSGGGVPPPGPTQPGAIASCKRWHTVVSGDGCWAIQQAYGVPDFAPLLGWNPGIGSNCESLWLGYSICVGV